MSRFLNIICAFMYSYLFVIGTKADVVPETMRSAVFSQKHYIVEGVPDCPEKTAILEKNAGVNCIKKNADKVFKKNYLVMQSPQQPLVLAVPKGKNIHTDTHKQTHNK